MSAEQSMRGDTVDVAPESDLSESAGIVETSRGRRLAGSRCTACPALAHPPVHRCVECGEPTSTVALADQGNLYAFTTVRVSSRSTTPYTIGYVDLDDGVRVLSPVSEPQRAHVDGRVAIEVAPGGTYLAQPLPEQGGN
ncbi:Zn-ribbon domain-containing OB-fold protein [Streptomyces sp. TP-A0874]|uniref:Zn-ribbon domain-containing OB-fold protein n=1 Tax=Streptomyces sp. TP-A0874 TaxID=549819 RepID=UPI000852E3E8|nr:OB-fold domain-containing protein [Streptomyces sp. TP-A0874]